MKSVRLLLLVSMLFSIFANEVQSDLCSLHFEPLGENLMDGKVWMAYVEKYIANSLCKTPGYIFTQTLIRLLKSYEIWENHKDVEMFGKSRGSPVPTSPFQILQCETHKRLNIFDRVAQMTVMLWFHSVPAPTGKISQNINTAVAKFCSYTASRRDIRLPTCTDVWTFHVHKVLGVHLYFGKIYFGSSRFDCCKGHIVVSKGYQLFSSETFFLVKNPHRFKYCGFHSAFNLYPAFQEVAVSRHAHENTMFEFTITFQVQHRNTTVSFSYLHYLDAQGTMKETNWLPTLKQTFLSFHVLVQRDLCLTVGLVGVFVATVHDGPGHLSKQLQLIRDRYRTSSFQCLVHLWQNDTEMFGALEHHLNYSSHKLSPNHKLILTANNNSSAKTFVFNNSSQSIVVLALQSASQMQINSTIVSLKYVGELDRISCLYGGIAALDEIHSLTPICDTQTFGANHRLYSSSASQTIIMYWYPGYSFVAVDFLISSTKCKPVHINDCMIDYLCHCSAVPDFLSVQTTKPEGFLLDVLTDWPKNATVCESYLERLGENFDGNLSYQRVSAGSGRTNVGTLLFDLSGENDCFVIQLQRTAEQLSEMRRTTLHGPIPSQGEFQFRPVFHGSPGIVYEYDIYGIIIPTEVFRPVTTLSGKETISLYGKPDSITPYHGQLSSGFVPLSSYLSTKQSPLLQIDSGLLHKIQYFVKDKSPFKKTAFTLFLSLLSQLMGSWIDITLWKNREHSPGLTSISQTLLEQDAQQLSLNQEHLVSKETQNTKVVKLHMETNKPPQDKTTEALLKYSSWVDITKITGDTEFWDVCRLGFHLIIFVEFQALFDAENCFKYFSFRSPGPFLSSLTLVGPKQVNQTVGFSLQWMDEDTKHRHSYTCELSTRVPQGFSCQNLSSAHVLTRFLLWFGARYLCDQTTSREVERSLGLPWPDKRISFEKLLSWKVAAQLCILHKAQLPVFSNRRMLDDFVDLIKYLFDLPLIEAAFVGMVSHPSGVCIS